MREVIFLPELTSSADCIMVSIQLLCAITCINICVHVTNPKQWHGTAIVWTHENTTHIDRNG